MKKVRIPERRWPIQNSQSIYGIGGCIDVETTGLSFSNDEVVELALVLFFYNNATLKIIEVCDYYTGLREPHCPISPGAFNAHRLTICQLKGKDLDNVVVSSLLKKIDFMVSHNARFDYNFVAPLFPMVISKPWYCSLNGIDWLGHGFASRGLQVLLAQHGIEIARAHRALDDARAVVTLLGEYGTKGATYLDELLESTPL